MPASASPRRLAIIGGGISGLAAAHRFLELDPEAAITLFEAGGRLGGVLRTEHKQGFLIEHSADMFTTKEPWALDLCRRLGLEHELIETNKENRRAYVVKRGKLVPVPPGFTLMAPMRVWPMVKTPLLSLPGKVRMAWEYFTPPRKDDADESLADFATRRLGREAYEWLVQPLIGGIYTADPEKLSMAATMRQFQTLERKYGGLLRGMRRARLEDPEDAEQSGARYNRFLAPRGGMSCLVDALAARLPASAVRLGSAVTRLERNAFGGWKLTLASAAERLGPAEAANRTNSSAPAESFDDVILSCGAHRAAELVREIDPELAARLADIPHAGVAIGVLGYRQEQIQRPLEGFGFVVPIVERRQILAASFSSLKFAGRAPEGCVLLRVFVGGACQSELLDQDDEQLLELIRKELAELLGVHGEPIFGDLVRWPRAMPQYHVGHVTLAENISRRAESIAHFALAGNSLFGVGIPYCVHSGEQAAERIAGRPAVDQPSQPV